MTLLKHQIETLLDQLLQSLVFDFQVATLDGNTITITGFSKPRKKDVNQVKLVPLVAQWIQENLSSSFNREDVVAKKASMVRINFIDEILSDLA